MTYMKMPERREYDPVPPTGVELAFHYLCPRCQMAMRVASPLRATIVTCAHCGTRFPIEPVDDSLLKFIHIITAGGKAATS